MTREQVLDSILLKRRFVKDCNLPITVFDNPYFYERICILDILFDSVDKFDKFCLSLIPFQSEQEYFSHYNEVKDKIIDDIKSKEDFETFQTIPSALIPGVPNKRNLYVEENDSKCFISIDMRKANFSALRHYSKAIFNGCETWEEYVNQFTQNEHIINSKYIRQVVLGACNPKRQIKYEHYLMSIMAKHIMVSAPEYTIYSLGEDEILIELGDNTYNTATFSKLIHGCPEGIGSLVRIEAFRLHKFNDGWYKKGLNDSDGLPDFKCVDAEIFHQIVKHYFKEEITQNDLVFYHNGRLARFLYEVDNPWQ